MKGWWDTNKWSPTEINNTEWSNLSIEKTGKLLDSSMENETNIEELDKGSDNTNNKKSRIDNYDNFYKAYKTEDWKFNKRCK